MFVGLTILLEIGFHVFCLGVLLLPPSYTWDSGMCNYMLVFVHVTIK